MLPKDITFIGGINLEEQASPQASAHTPATSTSSATQPVSFVTV